MAALIYQGRRQISAAVNVLKSHPDHALYYPEWVCSIHAEHAAVLKARSVLQGSTIYVARHGGENSKPCAGCMKVLKQSGVKSVIYTANGIIRKVEVSSE